jgi:hypothetical protein
LEHPKEWRAKNKEFTYQAQTQQQANDMVVAKAAEYGQTSIVERLRHQRNRAWQENLQEMAATFQSGSEFVSAEKVKRDMFDHFYARQDRWQATMQKLEELAEKEDLKRREKRKAKRNRRQLEIDTSPPQSSTSASVVAMDNIEDAEIDALANEMIVNDQEDEVIIRATKRRDIL